jgi:predicted ATPase
MNYPGARWWKVDFHTHSPVSTDYGKGEPNQVEVRSQTTPAQWLLGFMRAEIDAIVITDHNTGEWVDRVNAALGELAASRPAGFRALVVFPGVEITANGGAHVLAVLPLTATSTDVAALLGEVKYRGVPGASDVAAEASPIDVVRAIVARGGIPVLAHVDGPNSAFATTGNTLAPLLDVPDVHAMEISDVAWQPPELYRERHLTWSRVLGSDSHNASGAPGQRFPGSHFTWVKMESPSHEGLRLALLDGDDLSIRRSDQVAGDQNGHVHVVIESIEIVDGRYCGRSSTGPAPFRASLSPWLTTIIGGRGSGKSTLVEFSRMALRREDDLPEALKPDFDAFKTVAAGRAERGALMPATEVRLVVRKDGTRYRIQWGQTGQLPSIEEERHSTWVAASGDVARRFPVRIFSQGQIFEMARDGRALLRIIDDASEVDLASWKLEWKTEETKYLALRAKLRELQSQLADRPNVQGALDDAQRKLEIFEQAEHAQTLRDYQRSQAQRHAVETWQRTLSGIAADLRAAGARLSPPDLDTSAFAPGNEAERALLTELVASRDETIERARRVGAIADEASGRHDAWVEQSRQSAWAAEARQIDDRYTALVAELSARGVADPDSYRTLVQQRQANRQRLLEFDDMERSLHQVTTEADASLSTLGRLRSDLTARRARFLTAVLRDNPHVRMTVEPYGNDPAAAERGFREVLSRADAFAEEILSEDGSRGCLADLYRNLPSDAGQRVATLEQRLSDLKTALRAVAGGNNNLIGRRFARHVQNLTPEQIDRLMLWSPADELFVRYSPRGDGQHFRSLEQGSRGQKAAAIVAFLLAHGAEPIVLDQPEDDLDNELIYQLVVTQLRANKGRRQLVVVTHDPNIVVNGDAELIVVMNARAGQCRLLRAGSLQSKEIRDEVCNVMEGGREALEKRYRRMITAADRR